MSASRGIVSRCGADVGAPPISDPAISTHTDGMTRRVHAVSPPPRFSNPALVGSTSPRRHVRKPNRELERTLVDGQARIAAASGRRLDRTGAFRGPRGDCGPSVADRGWTREREVRTSGARRLARGSLPLSWVPSDRGHGRSSRRLLTSRRTPANFEWLPPPRRREEQGGSCGQPSLANRDCETARSTRST